MREDRPNPPAILFLCLGNICRSPLAEFIMKDLVNRSHLSDRFEIASAATSTEEIGNPVYPPARAKLAEHGLSCAGKTARQMTKQDYICYDYIVAMDQWNLKNIARIIGEDKEHKVTRLLDWTSEPRDIADPWYTEDYDRAYDDILYGCRCLLQKLS